MYPFLGPHFLTNLNGHDQHIKDTHAVVCLSVFRLIPNMELQYQQLVFQKIASKDSLVSIFPFHCTIQLTRRS